MLTSSLRDLLGGHPDPLLVELLVGAVLFDLEQGPVDGVDERAVLGERYPVLLARRDGLDELDLPSVVHDLPVRGGEVVDHPLDLAVLERREGLPDGPVRLDLTYLLVVEELFGLDLACRAGLDAYGCLGEVIDRLDFREARHQERLIGVEVGLREVYLLLALFGYGHRRDRRVEEVGVESPQDAVELDVLVLDLEAGPLRDLVHEIYVEALWLALGGRLERRVGHIGGDRDLSAHHPFRAGGFAVGGPLEGLLGPRAAADQEDQGNGEEEHRRRVAPRPSCPRELTLLLSAL